MEKQLELTLYQGHCQADGCSEGFFYSDNTSEKARKRYSEARSKVDYYLNTDWGIVIEGFGNLVEDDNEASTFIDYCQKNITGSKGTIQLIKCNHGRILFEKKIKFDGWKIGEIDSLMEKLKESDYQKKHFLSDEHWKRKLTPCSKYF